MNQALLKQVRENIRTAKCEVLQASVEFKDVGQHPTLATAEKSSIEALRLLEAIDRDLEKLAALTATETSNN